MIPLPQAAFNALEKACEDYPRKLDIEIGGTGPLDCMIPKFLQLSEHQSSKIRSRTVACLTYFVRIHCQSLFVRIDSSIACLFKGSPNENHSVRRHVWQVLVLLLAARPDKLVPEMANVAEYMLYSIKDKNENVALEACEFWLTFAEDPYPAPYLAPLLEKVAPVLLDCMVYGGDDLLWLEGDVEDVTIPDKETDIKPRHYGGGKGHSFDRDSAGEATSPSNEGRSRIGVYGEELADSDDFADAMSIEWNLRTVRRRGDQI